jgi:hypothetical protein
MTWLIFREMMPKMAIPRIISTAATPLPAGVTGTTSP